MPKDKGAKPQTTDNEPSGTSNRFRKKLDIADVVAKLLGAVAALIAVYIAHGYESKMSYTALINQREQAESSLRASMFQNLIDPIVGYTKGKKPDPDRERLLVELLTMNFHNHFELKPLLVDVSERLSPSHQGTISAERLELESVARRVMDRQIAMLRASGELMGEQRGPQNIWFRESHGSPPTSISCDKSIHGNDMSVTDAALFGEDWGQTVCVDSPDKEYQVGIAVTKADFKKRDVTVVVTVDRPVDNSTEEIYKLPIDFDLTPFDFPLTDNTQLDLDHRFAIMLYRMYDDPSDKTNRTLNLKFIWFPKGYVPERERPVNYLEMRRLLDMEKKY
jgi:hypothetical protein